MSSIGTPELESSETKLCPNLRGELAIQFQDDHGRPPTPVEALHLAQ
jgi:hypothetical protein